MDVQFDQLTSIQRSAHFRNDVQIAFYRRPENLELAKGFMFTVGDFGEKKSSADLLSILRKATQPKAADNRILIRANFGQGKTHFALAIANFFGKSANSPEVAAILEGISHAENGSDSAKQCRAFKEARKPFLIILLQGDRPGQLRDKFFRAFTEALKDYEETRNRIPPFWTQKAERFINGLSDSDRQKARAFLAARDWTFEKVIEGIASHDSATHTICSDLFEDLRQVRPDFGGEASIADAISWGVRHLCGSSGPLGGILVLFDEFSVFVRDYLSVNQAGVPLQDLLNGIDAHRGDALFVAFSQHEPEALLRDDGTHAFESLRKELTRLPKSRRYLLQSSFEDVLRGYFRPEASAWEAARRAGVFSNSIRDATLSTKQRFYGPHTIASTWNDDELERNLSVGCFPLHPMTAALLASLELEGASNRSALNFVLDAQGPVQRAMRGELGPATVGGKPNWIRATSLVDFFGEALGRTFWDQYKQVPRENLTDAEGGVLKGLLVQNAARIRVGSLGFAELIGQLAGLETSEARSILRDLDDRRYIQHDPSNDTYRFPVGSNLALRLHTLVRTDVENRAKGVSVAGFLDSVRSVTCNDATQMLQLSPLSVGVEWGNAEEWAAQFAVISVSALRPDWLENLLRSVTEPSRTEPLGIAARSVVFLVVPRSDQELSWLATDLRPTLDSSAYLRSAPFMVVWPERPLPELEGAMRKLDVLKDKSFTDRHRNAIGTPTIEEERGRLDGIVSKFLDQIRETGVIEVPQEARGAVGHSVKTTSKGSARLSDTMASVYASVYPRHPPAFNTKVTRRSKLADAVSVVVRGLVADSVADSVSAAAPALRTPADDLVKNYLKSSWKILSKDGRIIAAKSIEPVWSTLDGAVPGGGTSVRLADTLSRLVGAPFGYDAATLAVAVAAWIGANRHDLQLLDGSTRVVLGQAALPGKPHEFLKWLAGLSASRLDREALNRHAKALVASATQEKITEQAARTLHQDLIEVIDSVSVKDASLGAECRAAAKALEHAVAAQAARTTAWEMNRANLAEAKLLSQVLSAIQAFGVIPRAGLIDPGPLSDDALRSVANRSLAQGIEHLPPIVALEEYVPTKDLLEDLLTLTRNAGLDESPVVASIRSLDGHKHRLEAQASARVDLAQISAVSAAGSLGELRASLLLMQSFSASEVEEVAQAASQKATAIEKEISVLERFVAALPARIEGAVSAGDLEKLKPELDALASRVADEQGARGVCEDGAARLQEVLGILKLLDAPATTREQVDSLIGRITQSENLHSLSNLQSQLLRDKRAEWIEFGKNREGSATGWLANFAQRVERCAPKDLGGLIRESAKPPEFLSEKDLDRLEHLRKRLDELAARSSRVEQRVLSLPVLRANMSLLELQTAVESLSQIEPIDPEFASALAERRTQFNDEINQVMGTLTLLRRKIDEASSERESRRLLDEIHKQASRFAGSELEVTSNELIEDALRTAEILRAVVQPLNIVSPGDVERTSAEISTALGTLGVGATARKKLAERSEVVRATVAERQRIAEAWLVQLERESAQRPVGELNSKLDAVPVFLPEGALPRLRRLRDEVEHRAKAESAEREFNARVGSFRGPRSMVEALEQIGELSEFLPSAPSAAASARVEKLIDVRKAEILKAQSVVDAIEAELKECESSKGIEAIRVKLHQSAQYAAGSNLQARIDALAACFDELKLQLLQLESIASSTPSSATELDELLQRVDASMATTAAPGVIRSLRAAQEKLVAFRAREVEKASGWLSRIEADATRVPPSELHRRLEVIPVFLPPQGVQKVEELRAEARSLIDTDALSRIEAEYRKIRDPEARRACIARLQEIGLEQP
ncbi:MAG: hypothetical protein HYV07_27475 [Deltaproteobacteria bacterium]|nr:hypothetical protein [Deltaproteobacteria bacterium]